MIIDAHTHIDNATAWGWIDPPEVLLPLLDEAGIDRAVVMTYRDAQSPDDLAITYVREALARYPQRLIGFVRINPNAPRAMDALDYALGDAGFKGLKLHPVSSVTFPYGEATLKLMRRAAAYHAPVLFHTGDEMLALPEEVAEAARLCPETTVIMAHMGGYQHDQALIRAAKELPNVMVDTSASPYPWMIRRLVETIGAGRVLYASDGPGCLPALEVEKVRLANLLPEDEKLVFSGNILRLLEAVRHDI
jgi:uncharacterized protein